MDEFKLTNKKELDEDEDDSHTLLKSSDQCLALITVLHDFGVMQETR